MTDASTVHATAERRLRSMPDRAEQQVRNLELGLVAIHADRDTSQEDQDYTRQLIDAIRSDILRITRATPDRHAHLRSVRRMRDADRRRASRRDPRRRALRQVRVITLVDE